MRLIALTVMGLVAGLGLAAAIVSVPAMADKGPLRATLVAHLGGGQEEEEVPGGGDPDGEGRAVVKVFKEQLCARIETGGIESSLSKATIHLGMSGEEGPAVANLEEPGATPPPGATTPTTTTTVPQATTTFQSTTPQTTTPQTTTPQTTTAVPQATTPQATTPQTTTAVPQTSPSQSTAAPMPSASASASASALASSTPASTILEHTGGCVGVPEALSLELLEHPRRFYVNVTNGQYPEGAIRGQLHRGGDDDQRGGDDDDD